MKKAGNEVVTSYIQTLPEALKKRFLAIRETVLQAGPDLTEDIKWKNCLTYILGKKNLIQTVVGKDKISLIFHNGALIKDSAGLLQGDGNRTRTVRFEHNEFDKEALAELVLKSIEIEQTN